MTSQSAHVTLKYIKSLAREKAYTFQKKTLQPAYFSISLIKEHLELPTVGTISSFLVLQRSG